MRSRPSAWANTLLAIGSVGLTVMTLELVARTFVARWTPAPRTVDPRVVSIVVPHGKVHATNLLDYDVTERANSLGFVNHEPPPHAKVPGTFRVPALGDSFVEALQVPRSPRSSTCFETMAGTRRRRYRRRARLLRDVRPRVRARSRRHRVRAQRLRRQLAVLGGA